MTALLRKELRSLLPILALFAVLFGSELVTTPLLSWVDSQAWADSAGVEPGDGTSAGVTIIVLALLVAYALFPREQDERTLEFLYSLPVTRGRIFLAKVLAGALVLAGGFVLGQVVAWVLQLPNPQSFSGHQFRLDVALRGLCMHTALATIVLCHGVALSFFRRFGLVLYGVLAWAVILLQRLDPGLAILDPTSIVAMEYEGTRLLVPLDAIALHGVVAVVCLALAYALWMGPAERLAVGFTRGLERPVGKVALGCGTALIVVLAFALLIYIAEDGEDREPVRYASFGVARAETARFRFTYPLEARGRALRLIGRADAVHAEVRDALAAGDGDPIVVDLTERSAEHAGLTSWQKIRMDVASEEDEQALLHTFRHETVHALSLLASRRKLQDDHGATRFFSEGLAEHLAFRLAGGGPGQVTSRQHALVACTRQELPFHVLCDDDALRARHDPHLVYPVGETWVEALVRAYGPGAPGDVLRAMARDDAPRDLAPLAFWQDTLAAAGFDLERVNAAWHGLLDELEREHADFLASVPRLSGGVARLDGEDIVIVATLDRAAPPGTLFVARVRESIDTPDHELLVYVGWPSASDPARVTFRVDRGDLLGRRFDLQLGAQLPGFHLPICEAWQAAVVPR